MELKQKNFNLPMLREEAFLKSWLLFRAKNIMYNVDSFSSGQLYSSFKTRLYLSATWN